MSARILVVDDVPRNQRLLKELLVYQGYVVETVSSGESALESIRRASPDLVLLDVMLPGMSGYEVCRMLRDDESTQLLPIVMVTALDTSERVHGLEVGADDFITKPIRPAELLVRVRSLLRIKRLHDENAAQRRELGQWAATLERRVEDKLAEVERLSRLKRFFSPSVANLILGGRTMDPFQTHRAEVAVVFVDLRNFTSFSETTDPADVMRLLREYHAMLGGMINAFEGTVERFAGDMIMVFFNDPVPVDRPAERAVRMALAMQDAFSKLSGRWREQGYELGMGIGIAQGSAVLGPIGFEGRLDYGVVGSVCNLGARFCAHAAHGQTIVGESVYRAIKDGASMESLGCLPLKGFKDPPSAYSVLSMP